MGKACFSALLFVILLFVKSGDVSSALQSFVDGGSLMSFSRTTNGTEQLMMNDILQSTLYAQLNASSKYDRQTDSSSWYGAYVSILEVLGWKINISPWNPIRTSNVDWRTIIEAGMYQKLNKSDMENLDTTLTKYLQLPASSSCVRVFKGTSTAGDISNFQIIPVSTQWYNEMIPFGFFNLVNIEKRGSDVHTSQVVGAMVSVNSAFFSGSTYEKYRENVKQALAKSSNLIVYID